LKLAGCPAAAEAVDDLDRIGGEPAGDPVAVDVHAPVGRAHHGEAFLAMRADADREWTLVVADGAERRRPAGEDVGGAMAHGDDVVVRARRFLVVDQAQPREVVGQRRATEEVAEEAHQALAEIADRLGWCDQYFVSRQFKQVTGQTPAAFRGDYRG